MTTKRQMFLYWRLWRDACAAQGWDAIPAARRDDLRHECHRKALGYDRSSKDFTNQEFDRIKYWFRLLIDEDDIEAVIFWQDPHAKTVDRMEHAISDFPEALVCHICRSKFNTSNWRDLAPDQVYQLIVTLNRIRNNQSKQLPNDLNPARVEPVQV